MCLSIHRKPGLVSGHSKMIAPWYSTRKSHLVFFFVGGLPETENELC
jgi:hypothetical protein